jgi:hypothetical protein
VVEAGREEQRVRPCAGRRGGEAQSPEPVDHKRTADGPTELALERTRRRVIRVVDRRRLALKANAKVAPGVAWRRR